MSAVILVGLPQGAAQRLDAGLRNGTAKILDSWTFEQIRAPKRHPEILESQVPEVLRHAAAVAHPHIIGVSKQDRRLKQQVEQMIKPYFRFRWLNTKLLACLSDIAKFVGEFNAILEEEAQWASRIKPSSIHSPLVLPIVSFDCDPYASRMWQLAEEYGDPGVIVGAERAIEHFKTQYRRPVEGIGRCWVDSGERVFNAQGPRHGKAPFPRNWKMSFKLEDGFHYDVNTSHGRSFTLSTADGQTHTIEQGGYVNVDPHGWVRGEH